MPMHSVLILGACGFIGRNFVFDFLSKDLNVHVLDVVDTHSCFGLQDNLFHSGLHLSDTNEIYDYILKNNIDTVIHLVSMLIPSSTELDFKRELNEVINPTFCLIDLIKCNSNVRFIYFSSGGAIYGNSTCGIFSEHMKCNPVTLYGLGKLFIENYIITAACSSELHYLIIRPSNPYGRFQKTDGRQGVIAASVGRLLKGEKIQVWGDGSVVRDYIFIDDLCSITLSLLKLNVKNEIINVGSGGGYSVSDIVKMIVKSFGVPDSFIEYLPARKIDVQVAVLDISKLKGITELNFTSLDVGIKGYINSLLGNV